MSTDSGYVSLREYVDTLFREHLKFHASENKAIEVAREDLQYWKQAHNHWQDQMRDATSKFVPRDDYYREHKTLGERNDASISNLEKRMDEALKSLVSTVSTLQKLVYVGLGIAVVMPVVVPLVTHLLQK